MENKNIDWLGTLVCSVIAIVIINVVISIIDYFVGNFGSMEYRILMTIMFVLGAYQQAGIVMYEGWNDDGYEDVYPPENIRNGIRVLIIGIVLYIIFVA